MISGKAPWFDKDLGFEINDESIKKLEFSRSKMIGFSNLFDNHIRGVICKALDFDSGVKIYFITKFLTYLNRDTILSNTISSVAHKRKKIIPKKTGNGFDDVGGMESLKRLLKTKL